MLHDRLVFERVEANPDNITDISKETAIVLDDKKSRVQVVVDVKDTERGLHRPLRVTDDVTDRRLSYNLNRALRRDVIKLKNGELDGNERVAVNGLNRHSSAQEQESLSRLDVERVHLIVLSLVLVEHGDDAMRHIARCIKDDSAITEGVRILG